MDLVGMFEEGIRNSLFTDYQVSVRGPVKFDAEGGVHISSRAKLFDIASLTKALTHLVYLKMFSEGRLSPESLLSEYICVPGAGERKLWHFLSYLVQPYAFEFDEVRYGGNGSMKKFWRTRGFKEWSESGCWHDYDNHSSCYLGLVLEEYFGKDLETILHEELGLNCGERQNLLFHPVFRQILTPEEVVPTSPDKDGVVHDAFARAHQDEHLSVAGLFSKASVIADAFHRGVDRLVASGFYDVAAANQLESVGISPSHHSYALGFDLPHADSIKTPIELPLIFAGRTGCRLFFSKEPRLTLCFLTNRAFYGDSEASRKALSKFSWGVINEVLRSVTPTT